MLGSRQHFGSVTSRRFLRGWCIAAMVGGLTAASLALAAEYLNGIEWEEPKIVTPGPTDREPPSDAIVLFDGTDLSQWNNGENWKVEDGVAYTGKGKIVTKESFGDCQLHLEWKSPVPPTGSGQGRGNSGVFLMDAFEVQVLDSYDNKTYYDGQAGAIYKQSPPAVNAMRPPGQWNTYDIFFTAPRFDDEGNLESRAVITVVHNGVLIHHHFELLGDTPFNRPPRYDSKMGESGPISLQDHGNPVGFRNIWVRHYKPAQGKQVRKPYLRDGNKEIPIEE